jgi:hypothetical protein
MDALDRQIHDCSLIIQLIIYKYMKELLLSKIQWPIFWFHVLYLKPINSTLISFQLTKPHM